MNNLSFRKRPDEGSVLIVVLLILATLVLGVFAFSETALSEYRAMRCSTNEVRTDAAAVSGVRFAAHDLGKLTSHVWTDSKDDQVRFILLRGTIGTIEGAQLGLLNECAKLNINSIDLAPENASQSRTRLMAIPGVTEIAADSILDWMDSDEDPREFGAESNWYLSNGHPYTPRQDRFANLNELLLVRGVDVGRLFGDDLNGNGWRDWNEVARSATAESAVVEMDIASFQIGWSRWMTVDSAESNLNQSHAPKIFLNQPTLHNLFLELEPIVGTDAARFVVAMRMNGPIDAAPGPRFDSNEAIEKRREGARQRAIRQTVESTRFDHFRATEIGGFSINRASSFQFTSLVDLINARTWAAIEGRDEVLHSPWNAEGRRVSENLEWLEQRLSTFEGDRIPGRVNFLEADFQVLMSVPGMQRSTATAILKMRSNIDHADSHDLNVGWLYEKQIVNLDFLKKIAPFLTAGGDVYSGVSVGQILGTPQCSAYSFLVDATDKKVRTRSMIRRPMFHKDLLAEALR